MNERKKTTWKQAAIIGALIVHLVAGTVVFVLGAILGCKPFMPDGARSAYGLEGGANGIETLVVVYVFTLGIAPLVLSAIGAVIGVVLGKSFRNP